MIETTSAESRSHPCLRAWPSFRCERAFQQSDQVDGVVRCEEHDDVVMARPPHGESDIDARHQYLDRCAVLSPRGTDENVWMLRHRMSIARAAPLVPQISI